MEMSGLEYVGSLAILVLFFIVLVKLGEEFGKNPEPDVPEFGLPPASEKERKRLLKSYNRYKKNKKKKKRKKKKAKKRKKRRK